MDVSDDASLASVMLSANSNKFIEVKYMMSLHETG